MARSLDGCSFDNLCDGSCKSYACDKLIDITNGGGNAPTVQEAEQMLLDHLYHCVQSIEEKRGCKLEYFYIGKTCVKQSDIGGADFDHMDERTWSLDDGIKRRWRYTQRLK